jgi:PAS domain S-box-containing protein
MTDPGEIGHGLSPDTAGVLRELDAVKLQELANQRLRIELNEACVEGIPSGLAIVDQRGVIVSVNRAVEVMFGHSRKELIGQSVEMLVPAHLREKHAAHRAKYARDPRLRPMGIGLNAKGVRKTGDDISINVMLCPLVVSSGTYYLAIVHAILPVLAPPSPKQEVLIVEDDIGHAAMLVNMLVGAGYVTTVAGTGELALFEIGVKDYAIALVDLRLPDMDGIELPARAQALAKDVPMIAISGDLPPDEELLAAGFTASAGKPLRASELKELIATHIKPGRAAAPA